MKSVAIIEPHRMTRIGIEHVVAQSSEVTVGQAVALVEDLVDRPTDVIILNPLACGADLHGCISALKAVAPVLLMSSGSGRAELLPALHAGVARFLTPDVDDAELIAAIDAVSRGAFYVMAGLGSALQGELDRRPATVDRTLARREIETLRLVAQGFTHRQIARRLGLTEATVNTYVKRIRAKLNAGNKAELTRQAIDLGYLPTSAPVSAISA